MLLLYAEALNEWHKAPSTDAYAAINIVRRRGYGLPTGTASATADLATGLSYEQFQQAVRDERAHELAFEGHRRQDLVRWGIYYETIRKTAAKCSEWHVALHHRRLHGEGPPRGAANPSARLGYDEAVCAERGLEIEAGRKTDLND